MHRIKYISRDSAVGSGRGGLPDGGVTVGGRGLAEHLKNAVPRSRPVKGKRQKAHRVQCESRMAAPHRLPHRDRTTTALVMKWHGADGMRACRPCRRSVRRTACGRPGHWARPCRPASRNAYPPVRGRSTQRTLCDAMAGRGFKWFKYCVWRLVPPRRTAAHLGPPGGPPGCQHAVPQL